MRMAEAVGRNSIARTAEGQLRPSQFAYRPGAGAVTHLAYLTSVAHEQTPNDQFVILASLGFGGPSTRRHVLY